MSSITIPLPQYLPQRYPRTFAGLKELRAKIDELNPILIEKRALASHWQRCPAGVDYGEVLKNSNAVSYLEIAIANYQHKFSQLNNAIHHHWVERQQRDLDEIRLGQEGLKAVMKAMQGEYSRGIDILTTKMQSEIRRIESGNKVFAERIEDAVLMGLYASPDMPTLPDTASHRKRRSKGVGFAKPPPPPRIGDTAGHPTVDVSVHDRETYMIEDGDFVYTNARGNGDVFLSALVRDMGKMGKTGGS